MAWKVDTHELAWAAGFFDGEGCVSISRQTTAAGSPQFTLSVQISQVERAPLDRFKLAIGGLGNVTGPYNKVYGVQPIHQYRCGSFEKSQAIIGALWKFLSEPKRRQASSRLLEFLSFSPTANNPSRIGGVALMARLSHDERTARAQRAAFSRWHPEAVMSR